MRCTVFLRLLAISVVCLSLVSCQKDDDASAPVDGDDAGKPCDQQWDGSVALCKTTTYSAECAPDDYSYLEYEESTEDGSVLKRYTLRVGAPGELYWADYDKMGRQIRSGRRWLTPDGRIKPPCYSGDECNHYEYDEQCRLTMEGEGCEELESCHLYRWTDDPRMHLEKIDRGCRGWTGQDLMCITTARVGEENPVDRKCNENPNYCRHLEIDGCESMENCEAGGYWLLQHDQGCDGTGDECEYDRYYPGGELWVRAKWDCLTPMNRCLLYIRDGRSWRSGLDQDCDGTLDHCGRRFDVTEERHPDGSRTEYTRRYEDDCDELESCYVTDYDSGDRMLFSGKDQDCDKMPDSECMVYKRDKNGRILVFGRDADCDREPDHECEVHTYDAEGRQTLQANDLDCDGKAFAGCHTTRYGECMDDDALLQLDREIPDGDMDMDSFECSVGYE